MKNFLKDPKKAAKVHVTLAAFWLAMMIPTLILWKDSVLWVSLMSCYALVGAHVASLQAAAGAGVDQATHDKLNAIADALADFLAEAGYADHAKELRHTVGLEEQE
jgi:hypothetical protein